MYEEFDGKFASVDIIISKYARHPIIAVENLREISTHVKKHPFRPYQQFRIRLSEELFDTTQPTRVHTIEEYHVFCDLEQCRKHIGKMVTVGVFNDRLFEMLSAGENPIVYGNKIKEPLKFLRMNANSKGSPLNWSRPGWHRIKTVRAWYRLPLEMLNIYSNMHPRRYPSWLVSKGIMGKPDFPKVHACMRIGGEWITGRDIAAKAFLRLAVYKCVAVRRIQRWWLQIYHNPRTSVGRRVLAQSLKFLAEEKK